MSSSSQEAEGQLRQRLPVCLEIWQNRWDELPDAWMRRLGTRQRQFPHPSQVGGVYVTDCN